MKKLLLIPVLASTFNVYTPVVHAADIAQSLCEYVAADDKKRLRSFLKTNKLNLRTVFDSVQCNGQNLVAFAASKNSMDTGELMLSKLPKKVVADIKATITSAELAAKAEQRINS